MQLITHGMLWPSVNPEGLGRWEELIQKEQEAQIEAYRQCLKLLLHMRDNTEDYQIFSSQLQTTAGPLSNVHNDKINYLQHGLDGVRRKNEGPTSDVEMVDELANDNDRLREKMPEEEAAEGYTTPSIEVVVNLNVLLEMSNPAIILPVPTSVTELSSQCE